MISEKAVAAMKRRAEHDATACLVLAVMDLAAAQREQARMIDQKFKALAAIDLSFVHLAKSIEMIPSAISALETSFNDAASDALYRSKSEALSVRSRS